MKAEMLRLESDEANRANGPGSGLRRDLEDNPDVQVRAVPAHLYHVFENPELEMWGSRRAPGLQAEATHNTELFLC